MMHSAETAAWGGKARSRAAAMAPSGAVVKSICRLVNLSVRESGSSDSDRTDIPRRAETACKARPIIPVPPKAMTVGVRGACGEMVGFGAMP